jgi:hypothetical protein
MASWTLDLMLFAFGFLAGTGAAFAAMLVARMRREASVEGRELVDRLGPLGSRRFLAVISDPSGGA